MASVEGYIKKRPDPNWWMEQIRAGEQYRKDVTHQAQWDTWRNYYRGNWRPDTMPVNLFFSMLRSMVPRVYFRNPSVSVAPSKPGMLNLAFARVLERVDNKLIRRMKLKKQMKKCVQDTFLFGTGIPKVGFGGLYSPTPTFGGEEIPLGKSGELVEYADFTEPMMPWVRRTHPGNFVVPAGLMDYEETRWTAEYILRPIDDVRSDPRLENVKELVPSVQNQTLYGSINRPVDMLEMYEIRDRKTGSVFLITPSGANRVLLFESDAFHRYGGFPHKPMTFNPDDEYFWGVPDSKILDPYQRDANETRTLIMKHKRLTLVKMLVRTSGMDQSEAEKLVSEDVAAIAFVKGPGSVRDVVTLIQSSTIPPELFASLDLVRQDVRESVGFSRNDAGEFNSQTADTTATEAQIVRQASEIRIDERRDVTADVVVEIVEMMHAVIFDNWGQEQIVDVVGPGGVPVWVSFRGELLKQGRYSVKVDPDSSLPETKQLREQRAIQLYTILKENPIIDPIKLTQYLLRELQGVQFDDMMRMLPPPEGGAPQEAVGTGGFASMIGNSLTQLGRPGGQGLLNAPPGA